VSVELVAGGGMTENLHGTPQSYETIGRFLALLLDHISVAWNTTVAALLPPFAQCCSYARRVGTQVAGCRPRESTQSD
jgi:hypothetical protein